MLILVSKTILIYFVILILLRIMGKRELSRLSPFDLVVAIMIAELAVFPIEDRGLTIIEGLFPILILVILEVIMAYISLKSNNLRAFINGRPEILIQDGQIKYQKLKKNKYSINDLLLQLRKKSIFNIDQVEIAVLETSGDLTVIKKGEDHYAFPVIIDSKITNNYNLTGVNRDWLENEINKENLAITEIILATIDHNKEIKYYLK